VSTHWSALLLLDISGFTRLSSVIGAEKLKMHCNLYFSNILKIIANYNGDVLKFLGDALFVIWPVDKDSEPEIMAKACAVAAEAACAIMAVGNYDANDINPNTHEAIKVKLRLHCALSCGRTNFFHIGMSLTPTRARHAHTHTYINFRRERTV
jgi:class 3 adenylate cyclase